MNDTLTNQIRGYFAYVDEVQGEIDIETALDPVVGDGPVRPIQAPGLPSLWSLHPRLAMMAAAAAVLVVVGGFALLARFPGSDRLAVTTPQATGPSTSSELGPAIGRQLATTWELLPNSAAILGEGEIRDVTVGGPGLVGVGSTVAGDEHADAAVWTSVDGSAWHRLPHNDAIFGNEWMSDVIAGGPGLIAVGTSVWTSSDGIDWMKISDEQSNVGEGSMESVTAGGPGYVAVGRDWSRTDDNAAVWTSVDGISWQRVPNVDGVFGGEDFQQMWSVAVGGPGLVAVGIDWFGGQADAAVWASVDGIAWTRVPDNGDMFGGPRYQAAWGVTGTGPGVVVVGVERTPNTRSATVWRSLDGYNWTRLPDDQEVFGGGEMVSVTRGPEGLVAVGRRGLANQDAAVWTSVAGITWSRVPPDEDVFGGGEMLAAIGNGNDLIAVGSVKSDETADAAVWVGSFESESVDPTELIDTLLGGKTDVRAILEVYQDLRNSGNVEAVLALYDDEAVVRDHPLDPGGVASGVEEIRRFEGQVPMIQMSTGGIEFLDIEVSGATATFNHRFIDSEGECFGGTGDTVTVDHDGKITLYDWGVDSPVQCK